jgi:hypothetical protein
MIITIVGTPQMFLRAVSFPADKDNSHSSYHEKLSLCESILCVPREVHQFVQLVKAAELIIK